MARNIEPFAHVEINVEDLSNYTPIRVETLPVHRPLYAMVTQKGRVGIPTWNPTIVEAREEYGEETFNLRNALYSSPASAFLLKCFETNGAFITRLAGNDAEKASLVLELEVWEDDIQQYDKDASGRRLLADGKYVETTSSGVPVESDGYKLRWVTRELGADEVADELTVKNSSDAERTAYTSYPIMVLQAKSVGAWGNDVGLRLFWDSKLNPVDRVQRIDSIMTGLEPVVREYNAATLDPVRNIYGDVSTGFSFNPDAYDGTIRRQLDAKSVLTEEYADGQLPFTVYTYNTNVKAVGDLIAVKELARAKELETDPLLVDSITVDTGYEVNLMSLKDIDGLLYDTVELDSKSKDLNKYTVHYLLGGNDGDVTDVAMETLVRNFYELDANPQIIDKARYPFTHIYDVGYSLDTKDRLLDFMAYRDDVKVMIGTQCVTKTNAVYKSDGTTLDYYTAPKANSQAEDAAAGASLRGRGLLIPESVLKGTGACRFTIFQQCAVPYGDYNGVLPMTYWSAVKKARFQNLQYLDEMATGRTNAIVDMVDPTTLNWVSYDPSQKLRSWEAGLNYCEYANMTDVFYASVRTGYDSDTSVLVDDEFTDALIYTKHEVFDVWSLFSGVIEDPGQLRIRITKEVTDRLNTLYNGRYTFEVDVFQTEEEAKLGYVHHVAIRITSATSMRVLDVDIICEKPTG